MIKALIFLISIYMFSAYAYVPTVESLFRHGANPDVTTNALVLSAKVTSVNSIMDAAVDQGAVKPIWIKLVYNITPHGRLKFTQLIYDNASMQDASLVAKTYVAELTPQAFSAAQTERGMFLGLMNSILINDGSFLVEFLRHNETPVKLNKELINTEKLALLQRYRTWLAQGQGKKTNMEESPLMPTQSQDRERVSRIMAAPMFVDTGQVYLARYAGEPTWQVRADPFEAWVDDAQREIRQLVFKQPGGEIEMTCREPIMFNGIHRAPRFVLIKNSLDQYHQVELLSLKHFNESSTEMVARLRRYDQALMHRNESPGRPAFLF